MAITKTTHDLKISKFLNDEEVITFLEQIKTIINCGHTREAEILMDKALEANLDNKLLKSRIEIYYITKDVRNF